MAEKTTSKRRSSRQAVVEVVAEAEKAAAGRKEAEAKPEERIAAKAVSQAVAVADAISSEDVVRSIAELKSTITRTLTQLSDRLEEEVNKFSQVRRAIAAKDAELAEIYEIQRSASTLQAILSPSSASRKSLNASSRRRRSNWTARSKRLAPVGAGEEGARARGQGARQRRAETSSARAGGVQVQLRPRTAARARPAQRRAGQVAERVDRAQVGA